MKGISKAKQIPRRAARLLVTGYRYSLSPLLGVNCRHLPSCSEYADEAIGRFLGNVQIGTPDQGGDGAAEPQANRKRSKKETPSPTPNADSGEQGDNAEPEPDDPDLDRILR